MGIVGGNVNINQPISNSKNELNKINQVINTTKDELNKINKNKKDQKANNYQDSDDELIFTIDM